LVIQYPDLNALKETFNGAVAVVGVPCAQFKNQEPGTPEEIIKALEFVRPGNGFKPNFPLTEKSEVNGENRIPLYTWALDLCPSPVRKFNEQSSLLYSPYDSHDIRWNFEKILFNKMGHPVKRYEPSTKVSEIIPDIKAMFPGWSEKGWSEKGWSKKG